MHEEQHHFQAEVHFDLHVGVGFADNGDSNGVDYMSKIDGVEHRFEGDASIITGIWQMNSISTTYPDFHDLCLRQRGWGGGHPGPGVDH